MIFIKYVIAFIIWFFTSYIFFLFQPASNFEAYILSLKPKNYEVHLKSLYSQENSDLIHLFFTADTDTSLSAYIKIPSDSSEYSSIIILGGMQTGKYAVNYAYGVNNVILAAPNYRYKPKQTYNLITILFDLSEAYNATYLQIVDNLLLIEFLKNWDRSKNKYISILGYSFGVPFATATARFDGIDYLALVYGGADLDFLIQHNLKLFNPILDFVLAKIFWLHVINFEPVYNLQNIKPIPTLVINGKDDEKIPEISVQKMHNAIHFEKTIISIDSKHVHPANKNLSIKIIGYLNSWFSKNKFFD